MSSLPTRSPRNIASNEKNKVKVQANAKPQNSGFQQEMHQSLDANINTNRHSHSEGIHGEEFPPGYRFHPYDNELITHYLQKKVNKEPMLYNRIPDVNLYKHNPNYLAGRYKVLGDKEWYFFTPRDRKYRKGKRPSRAAGDGYWKATGADKSVEQLGVVIGKKRTLVFYLGKQPSGEKTNWIMHEYTAVSAPPRIKENENDMTLDDWVLCKIYKKTGKEPRDQQDQQKLITDTPTALDEITPCTNEHSIAEKNYDYNMCNGQLQSPQLSVFPSFSDTYSQDFSNFNVYQQPQVLNYTVQQSFGYMSHLGHPTPSILMSKYMQEDFGSFSTTQNLPGHQYESVDASVNVCGFLPNNNPPDYYEFTSP